MLNLRTDYSFETLRWLSAGFLQPCTMSVIHRLAGRLFPRAGPCLGDTVSGDDRHDQPQGEREACCCSEFSFWSGAGARVKAVAQAILHQLSISWYQAELKEFSLTDNKAGFLFLDDV